MSDIEEIRERRSWDSDIATLLAEIDWLREENAKLREALELFWSVQSQLIAIQALEESDE